jgi:hypothetical protein
MACTRETAGGVKLVEVDAPAGPVEYRKTNVEPESQGNDNGNSDGGGRFPAARLFGEGNVLCQILCFLDPGPKYVNGVATVDQDELPFAVAGNQLRG